MTDLIHVVCPGCHATNRVARQRLRDQPKCGSCKHALFNARPLGLDLGSFERHISRNEIPVVVDFWAPWCGPCKVMAPEFEKAAVELEPKVRLTKLNTEEEPTLAARFGIRSIPTMVLFRGGKEVARQPGAMGASDIVRWVQAQI